MQLPLEEFRTLLGPNGVIAGPEVPSRAVGGWSRLGVPLAILRPASTAEVSAIARICARDRLAMVPWGGRTGLVDGALADCAVAISLERMSRIEAVDPVNGTMTVEAGCVVQTACEAATAHGMFFALDLGSRGSATIGGTIATNAGGNRVVRFGMMRELVLGLEAVLADGSVISSLYPFIKNNTGYDLKQLFIGSEGTLGIVTRAVLRLRPQLTTQQVALIAAGSFQEVLRLLRRLEARLGGRLSAFEVMWPEFYELVTTPPAKGRQILAHGQGFYVLIESLGGDALRDAEGFEAPLVDALEEGEIADAVIAKSQAECDEIWALRDDASQVQRNGPIASFDISLRLTTIESFDISLRRMLAERWPAARPILFGHIGDGNIHVVVSGVGHSPDARSELAGAVFEVLARLGGSVSAEHGVGLDKRPYLGLSRNAQEIALMRHIKYSLDPQGLLNPGKILDTVSPAAGQA